MSPSSKLTRRGALVGLGAGIASLPALAPAVAGAAAQARTSREAAARPHAEPLAPLPSRDEAHGLSAPGPEVRAFLGPLREGATVERWRIESVHAVRHGAIPLVLSGAGGRFAIEILRRDPSLSAPADAGPLSILVQNRGDGARATREEQGLGAMAIARALEARIAAGARVPAGLLTQPERAACGPDAILHVPV